MKSYLQSAQSDGSFSAHFCFALIRERNGESSHPQPIWLEFDSRSRRHVWPEFVVGSLLAPRGFSAGSPVFPSPQKPTLPNSNSIRNARTDVERVPVAFLMCAKDEQTIKKVHVEYLHNNNSFINLFTYCA